MSKRECIESPLEQSPDESIAYGITATPWASAPTNLVVVVWDVTDGNAPIDVTSTTTEGSQAVAGALLTTKRIHSLTVGSQYRVDVLFDDEDGNTLECFFRVFCRD